MRRKCSRIGARVWERIVHHSGGYSELRSPALTQQFWKSAEHSIPMLWVVCTSLCEKIIVAKILHKPAIFADNLEASANASLA